MEKAPNKFMSVVYQLYTIADGKETLEEQTGEERPFEFISGFSLALDGFEQQVTALEKGSAFDFVLEPAQAFGEYVPEGVHKLEREVFTINGHFDHDNIHEGAIITLNDTEGHNFHAKVTKVEEDGVTVDTNHPLAGKSLNFTGTIRENRDATEEEVSKTIKMLTGGCHGCGHHHGEGEDCDCCGHNHEQTDDCGCGCGHCH